MKMNTTLDRVPVGSCVYLFSDEEPYRLIGYSKEWELWIIQNLRTGKQIYADAFRCKVIENPSEAEQTACRSAGVQPPPILQKQANQKITNNRIQISRQEPLPYLLFSDIRSVSISALFKGTQGGYYDFPPMWSLVVGQIAKRMTKIYQNVTKMPCQNML